MTIVTVGMPVYNGMRYLEHTMRSLLEQSEADFAILVLDDGSTDGSGEFIRGLGDPRIKVLTQANAGVTCALNRLLAACETPWLLRHDADDVALPNKVAAATRAARAFPDAGVVHWRARYYGSRRELGAFRSTAEPDPLAARALVKTGRLLSICHPTALLSVEKVRTVGGYRFDMFVEDVDLWWRMALAHEIRFEPELTTLYRIDPRGVSSTHLAKQSLAMIYVQYLLVCALRGRTALPFDEMRSRLEPLLDRGALDFRARVRAGNIALADGMIGRALRQFGSALCLHPVQFARRALYEWRKHGQEVATNGVDPKLLAPLFA